MLGWECVGLQGQTNRGRLMRGENYLTTWVLQSYLCSQCLYIITVKENTVRFPATGLFLPLDAKWPTVSVGRCSLHQLGGQKSVELYSPVPLYNYITKSPALCPGSDWFWEFVSIATRFFFPPIHQSRHNHIRTSTAQVSVRVGSILSFSPVGDEMSPPVHTG